MIVVSQRPYGRWIQVGFSHFEFYDNDINKWCLETFGPKRQNGMLRWYQPDHWFVDSGFRSYHGEVFLNFQKPEDAALLILKWSS
jgi:hypothetical protein